MRRAVPVLLLTLVACSSMVLYVREEQDTLYFGMNKAHGGIVTDAEWEQFLNDVVTPRFPGFTQWKAQGSWKGQREESRVLVLTHEVGHEADIRTIIAEGEKRLDQEEVFQVREDVWRPMSQVRAK